MRLTKGNNEDVKDEEPEQEIGSFEALGGSDETKQQEDVKDEEPEQEIGSFEALGGSDETDQGGDTTDKKMLKMKNLNKRVDKFI